MEKKEAKIFRLAEVATIPVQLSSAQDELINYLDHDIALDISDNILNLVQEYTTMLPDDQIIEPNTVTGIANLLYIAEICQRMYREGHRYVAVEG